MERARLCTVMSLASRLLVVCLLVSGTVFGQGITAGSISGTITDATGSVVPGVQVTVTNILTNVSKTVASNADGSYSMPNLAVSKYRVTAEKQGFKVQVSDDVDVHGGQSSIVDIRMSVGAVTQSVTVQGTVAPMTEDKGDRSVVLGAQTVTELPLEVAGSQRLDDSFLTLSPGVVGNTFTARINGGPDQNQDFYYDGAPYMNTDGGGRQEGNGPPVDAIDEYSITTNAYSAQYGRSTGLLNFHMRSGTNQLHGAGWEYVRNNDLDARGFFSPSVGTEKQNEFGFRVGGPVYIPKVYDGKDKTFFFFLADWFKYRGGLSTGLTTLPTKQMLQGNFSELPYAIYDPATTTSDGAGGLTRTAFPGNVIPAGRLSTLATPFLSIIPTATLSGVINNTLVSVPTAPTNNWSYDVKIDHNFGTNYVLHGSYYQWREVQPTSPTIPGPLGTGNNFFVKSWEPRLSVDQTLRPNLQNQTNFSYQYTAGTRDFYPLVPGSFNSPLVTAGQPWPAISIAGFPGFGAGANNNQTSGGCWPCVFFADNLKWIKGKHSLSMGVEYRDEAEKDAFSTNIGQYSFGSGTTTLPDAPNYGALGYGFAGFYLGAITGASKTAFVRPRTSQTGYRALYIQDDIKVNAKLTLNLGFRWDYSVPAHDTSNMMSTFDPTVPNPAAGGLLGSLVYEGSSGAPCITEGGAALCRKQIADTWYGMWQPRIGFAYRVGDKTVVRGGIGKSSIRGGASTLEGPAIAASFLAGFQPQTSLQSPDNGISPPTQLAPTWDSYFASGFPLAPAPPLTRSSANGLGVDFMQTTDDRMGYMLNWNLTIERKLPYQIVLESSYVGSTGVRLGANLNNMNQVPSQWLSLGPELGDDISCLTSNTCPGAIAAGVKLPYTGFKGSVAQALRPYPQFLSINANTQMDGHSTYNALQERAQRYFSNGVTFLVSFTWYKNLSNTRSSFGPFYGPPLDVANKGLEMAVQNGSYNGYGGAGPLTSSWAGVYDLPIGPGKKFANVGGPLGKVIGGWSLSHILTYSDGNYLSVTGGTPNPIYNEAYGDAFFGGGGPRPNLLQGVNTKAYSGGKFDPHVDYYLNSAAFADAGAYHLGTAPPALSNTRGFANLNENLSLLKTTKIRESVNVEFRAEFFNVFNRTQFCDPDGNYNDVVTGGFGRSSCQANTPRQIQFGIRLNF